VLCKRKGDVYRRVSDKDACGPRGGGKGGRDGASAVGLRGGDGIEWGEAAHGEQGGGY